MNEVNNININISLATQAVAQKGFGMALIIGTTSNTSSTTYNEATEPDELLDSSIGYASVDGEYKQAVKLYSQDIKPTKFAVLKLSAQSALATELAALRNNGMDDWYWGLNISRAKADLNRTGDVFESLDKFFLGGTSDLTALTARTGNREAYMISKNPSDFPEAAWLARCGLLPIGSVSWDSKILAGQQSSGLTTTERTTVENESGAGDKGNYIALQGGNLITWEGKTTGGQYIDIINGRDYLKARLTEAWFFLKQNNNKLPMDFSGLRMLEAALRAVFKEAGQMGIIATAKTPAAQLKSDLGEYQYKLNVPNDIDLLAANDRAKRTVKPITFTATIQGSINKVEITGVMGV